MKLTDEGGRERYIHVREIVPFERRGSLAVG
jgi:hypothetical protein